MTETLPFDITKYYKTGIVVDTNLMVLYIIGLFDIGLIERHNKTKAYTKKDFLTLYRLLENFNTTLTTPNILTETSNLTETGDEKFKDSFFLKFAEAISRFDERHSTSIDLTNEKGFKKFGLADSSITKLASQGNLVVTDDLKLSSYLSNQNMPVLNFNHIRTFYLLQ
jgi:predicted PolB exonuclease-like 3'-5' exonuclease